MTKRDRIVLSVIVVVAALGGFFFLAVKPKRAELARLDAQVAQAQTRIDAALADLRGAQAAKVAYKRDTATLALMGKAVPADDDVPSLLYQVHKAARTAGIGFESVTVGEGATAAVAGAAPTGPPGTQPGEHGLATLPLKVEFSGQFFELDRFLGLLHGFARQRGERLDVDGRLLTVDAVSLTPGPKGLKAEIKANAYVAPAEAGGTDGGKAAVPTTATPGAATPTPTTSTGATN